MAQGLLAVDVQSAAHGCDGGWGVVVVCRADHHAVEAGLLDELPPVGEDARVLEVTLRGGEGGAVHITQRLDVLTRDLILVGTAAPAGPDDAEVQLVRAPADTRIRHGRSPERASDGQAR